MAKPEAAIAVRELFKSQLSSISLQNEILQAGNESGALTAAEVLQLFRREHAAKKNAKWWTKVSLSLLALLVVLLAANAGLTYAVVALSKDTSVTNNTLVVSSNSSEPVMTAALEYTVDPATGTLLARGCDQGGTTIKTAPALAQSSDFLSLLYLNPENASSLQALLVEADSTAFAYYQVSGVEVVAGQEARLFTPLGTLVASADNGTVTLGLAAGAARGRRLLAGKELPDSTVKVVKTDTNTQKQQQDSLAKQQPDQIRKTIPVDPATFTFMHTACYFWPDKFDFCVYLGQVVTAGKGNKG